MSTQLLSIRSYPRAILHIDGDAFFASCEQSRNPKLRGVPVVTGRERGIAASMSYEAKAEGVTRGMSIREIQRVCPNAIIIPSDYETYSLLSRRFYSVVRRYTPAVEEYGVDECFADITGLRGVHRKSYEDIALSIKNTLDRELGFTFSVGLAPTKTLAKVASKWHKPAGFTAIAGNRAHVYLTKVPIEKIWGIGPQTSAWMSKQNIESALDFASRPEEWAELYLSKPFYETWKELRGVPVLSLNTLAKETYASIQKVKTFTPPSKDSAFVFAQLSKNIENACIKMRRYNLAAREVSLFLKFQDFRYTGISLRLDRSICIPFDITRLAREHWHEFFKDGAEYRSTGVRMSKLEEHNTRQLDFWGSEIQAEKMTRLFSAVDRAAQRYGKHSLYTGSSMQAHNFIQSSGERSNDPQRKKNLFKGEGIRQRLGIPMLMQEIT